MSSFGSWFWGTSKESAYIGWFVTLAGGVGIGAGGAIIVVTRAFAEMIPALSPNLRVNPEVYANFQLMGTGLVLFGFLLCLLGIFSIRHSQKTAFTQPSTIGKKFCRHCGTENKNTATFCEKCGKRIGESES